MKIRLTIQERGARIASLADFFSHCAVHQKVYIHMKSLYASKAILGNILGSASTTTMT